MNDNISMQRQKYGGFVQLIPGEIYLQFSNASQSIFLNNSLSAFVVDTCGKVLETFTIGLNFQYKEYFNIYSKKNNLIFEFFISGDYDRELLLLKFINNTTSEIWYSSPFQCTEKLKSETSYFEYKNEGFLKGVDYSAENYFQSIRLTCFKNDIGEDTQNEEYTQLSGDKIYSRNIVTNIDMYKFYIADWFTFKRLSFILNHSIIYINKFRAFSSPGKISKGERVEDSNMITLDFEANPTEEFKDYSVQLSTELQVIYLEIPDDTIIPFGNTIDNTFTVTFNKNVEILDASIKFNLCKEGVLIESKTPTVNLNKLSATFAHAFTDGNYFILVDPAKVGANSFGGVQIWPGINDATDWNFRLLDGESTNTELQIGVKWADGTITPKTGNDDAKLVYLDYLNTNNPADIVVGKMWQLKTTGVFTDVAADIYGNNLFNLVNGNNEMRLKATVQSGAVFHSNILTYTKQIIPNYPTSSFWYKAIHPDGNPGSDYVTYLDGSGQEQTQIFQRSYFDENGVYVPAPCTQVIANKIIYRIGVQICTPVNCKAYRISVPPHTTVIYSYTDCEGILRNYTEVNDFDTYDEINLCAEFGTLETNGAGYIELGDCGN